MSGISIRTPLNLYICCMDFYYIFESNPYVVWGWAILSLDQKRNKYITRTEHRLRQGYMFRSCCVGIPLLSKCNDREEIAEEYRIGNVKEKIERKEILINWCV